MEDNTHLENELKKVQIEKFRREAEKLEAEKQKIIKDQEKADLHDRTPFYKKPVFLQNFITILASFSFLGFYINTIILPIADTKNIELGLKNALASQELKDTKDNLDRFNDSLVVLKGNLDTLYQTYEIQYRALDSLKVAYVELTKKSIKEKEELIRQNERRLASTAAVRELGDANLEKLKQETEVLKKTTATAVASVQQIEKSLALFGPLNHFKIDIFCLATDNEKGLLIRQKLLEMGFQGIVEIKPRNSAFFAKVGAPDAYEVRYEAPSEQKSAERLVNILNQGGLTFRGRTVSTRTPNYLSIFIPTSTVVAGL